MGKNFKDRPLGGKKDVTDTRDKYKSFRPIVYPPVVILTNPPDIMDQGRQNSCTGHSVAWFWQQVLNSRNPDFNIKFSPLFPWFYARRFEGSEDIDEGVQMRSIMKAVNKHGICPLEDWDYSKPVNRIPSHLANVYGEALKLPQYERCETLESIKYSIFTEKQSVCLGIPLFDSFYEIDFDGVVPLPSPTESIIGYHAVTAWGFLDEDRFVKCANSWGPEFGSGGSFFLPYEYLNRYGFDAWTAGFEALPDAVIP